jgi:Domain of Unknown Function (DUF1080)
VNDFGRTRRRFLQSATFAAAVCSYPNFLNARPQSAARIPLFDGVSLNGWIDSENSATSFAGADILDLPALAESIAAKSDPVSAFIAGQLDDSAKAALASVVSVGTTDPKAATSALVKNLNQMISGPLIYDKSRFTGIALRAETQTLLAQNPQGRDLVHLNKLLLQDAFPSALVKNPAAGWVAKDGAIASTGAGRGVLYTARDFGRFRLSFTMRHVSGNPDHQACVLIFCTRPQPQEIPLDALGGIQFQVPKGGHWDYRPGQNNAGADFVTIAKPDFDPHQWSRVEILADASNGSARMAVAQPLGSPAVDILDFKNPAAGKVGPVALQMHNAGLFDEYKDIAVELDPPGVELKVR